MEQLRNTSYKELNEAMAWISFILMFASGGTLLIIALPVWVLVNAIKIGLDIYDAAQERIGYSNKWALLRNKIINLSSNKYFEVLINLLEEIDVSKKPAKLGSQKKWEYLNQHSEIALRVYSTIASIDEYGIDPSKRKIKTLSTIGLTKVEGSFQYVFQTFEHTNNKTVKTRFAETLVAISDNAPTHLILIFIEYILKDYPQLKSGLMNALIGRAQDFNQEDISKILRLASYGNNVNFYLQRTKYFFENAFDFSANKFQEDASIWLEKIERDFFQASHFSRRHFENVNLNEESGVLLAIASRELGNYERAIAVLEYVLKKKPNYLPATTHLVYIYEMLENYEEAKNVLVKSRMYIADTDWFQNKLREYNLS